MSSLQIADSADREDDDGSLSTNTIFETLSSRRRRYVLHYLQQVAGPVTIRHLSEQLAAWENGCERSVVTPKQRKRLYTALHQTHLPKMHRLGIIEYDKGRGVVSLTDSFVQFESYLAATGPGDWPWSRFYLVVGGVLTGLILAAGFGFTPLSWIGGYGYAAAVAVLFTGLALYQTYQETSRRRTRLAADETPKPPAELFEG